MQTRHAAFAVLRRLTIRDIAGTSQKLPSWKSPARQFHYIAPRSFHLSARRHNDEQHLQNPPQEPLQEPHKGPLRIIREDPRPAPPRKPSHVPKPPVPLEKQVYEMTFTCKPCDTRSTHRVSKQGYHFGSVLITCPECKNRHIISDHLGIFMDNAMTIEDFMRDRGQLVKKGTLSEDGDLEFWEDGSITSRAKADGGKEGVA